MTIKTVYVVGLDPDPPEYLIKAASEMYGKKRCKK
jgi:hypothetical protein